MSRQRPKNSHPAARRYNPLWLPAAWPLNGLSRPLKEPADRRRIDLDLQGRFHPLLHLARALPCIRLAHAPQKTFRFWCQFPMIALPPPVNKTVCSTFCKPCLVPVVLRAAERNPVFPDVFFKRKARIGYPFHDCGNLAGFHVLSGNDVG